MEGETVTLTATANTGYTFDRYYDGANNFTSNPFTFNFPAGDVAITAYFNPSGTNSATVSGTVTWPGHSLSNYTYAFADSFDGTYLYLVAQADVNSGTGNYTITGYAIDKYCIWVFNDEDSNSRWNNYESYVQVPERGACLFADDPLIDTATGDKTINFELGVLSGTIDTTDTSWAYPQAGLFQGWDVIAYNTINSLDFNFMGVREYSIIEDAINNQPQLYYIFRYNDDYTHDGLYDYPDESDEYKTGPTNYQPDATGLAPTTTTDW